MKNTELILRSLRGPEALRVTFAKDKLLSRQTISYTAERAINGGQGYLSVVIVDISIISRVLCAHPQMDVEVTNNI